jgi:hypothetical protein
MCCASGTSRHEGVQKEHEVVERLAVAKYSVLREELFDQVGYLSRG